MLSGFVIRCEDALAFRRKLLNRWNPRFLVSCRTPGAPANRNENFSTSSKCIKCRPCRNATLRVERKWNLLTSVFIYAEDIFTRIFHLSYSNERQQFDVFEEFLNSFSLHYTKSTIHMYLQKHKELRLISKQSLEALCEMLLY